MKKQLSTLQSNTVQPDGFMQGLTVADGGKIDGYILSRNWRRKPRQFLFSDTIVMVLIPLTLGYLIAT
jgi:hypothetical protein